MKLLTFDRLVGLSSIFIASCAAFFSIVGIGMLFSGSAIAAMIMASSLELGKLVATSFLYRYWNKTKLFLKIYLSTSVIVLMLITSLGIFGYLSSAYQQSSIENQLLIQKIDLIEGQKKNIVNKIDAAKVRIVNINQLRNSQELRLSQTITNALIARNPIQLNQLQQQTQELIEQSEKNLETENNKIQKATDELQQLDTQIVNFKLQGGAKKDVQTFKFVADEFGVSMNKVVKWFIAALISVFDPLAVCLLLAYNTTLEQPNKPNNIITIDAPKKETDSVSNVSTVIAEEQNVNAPISASTEVSQNTEPNSTPSTDSSKKIYPFSF